MEVTKGNHRRDEDRVREGKNLGGYPKKNREKTEEVVLYSRHSHPWTVDHRTGVYKQS